MNQKEFTNYAVVRLFASLPILYEGIISQQDDILDIELQSKNKNLTLLISTRGNELTIGSTTGNMKFDGHIHMGLFGAKTPEQMVDFATKIINDIINDKTPILYSSVYGYNIDFNPYFIKDFKSEYEKYKDEGEIIEYTSWSKL